MPKEMRPLPDFAKEGVLLAAMQLYISRCKELGYDATSSAAEKGIDDCVSVAANMWHRVNHSQV